MLFVLEACRLLRGIRCWGEIVWGSVDRNTINLIDLSLSRLGILLEVLRHLNIAIPPMQNIKILGLQYVLYFTVTRGWRYF